MKYWTETDCGFYAIRVFGELLVQQH